MAVRAVAISVAIAVAMTVAMAVAMSVAMAVGMAVGMAVAALNAEWLRCAVRYIGLRAANARKEHSVSEYHVYRSGPRGVVKRPQRFPQ
jgi:hypothetical protein